MSCIARKLCLNAKGKHKALKSFVGQFYPVCQEFCPAYKAMPGRCRIIVFGFYKFLVFVGFIRFYLGGKGFTTGRRMSFDIFVWAAANSVTSPRRFAGIL